MNQFNVSLWGDEAFSAILSTKSIPEIILISSRDTHPPLFNILEHFWFIFFGNSEISIRSLVFLLFLISVFFVYKIGESLWDKKTGVMAAVLTALNPFFFAYAFEGRMYSLLAATTAASMYFFVNKKWVFYVIATTLALYSHHFAFFAVFVQGLWFLKEFFWGNRKAAVSIFKSFVAIGILYSPWLVPLYNQTKMVGSGFWLGKPTLKDFSLLLLKYLNFSLVLLLVRNWSKKLGKSVFILMWFIVPILTAWILSQKFQSIFSDRYLLYTIPAAMLLAASQRTIITKIFLFIVFAVFISADVFYFTHPFKRPFRELAAYVKEVKHGDDYLINWNGTVHHLWESKYYGIGSPLYIPKGADLPFFVGTALMTKDDTTSLVPAKIDSGKTVRVGVITSGPVDEVVVSGYTKGEVRQFGDLKFIWLNK